MSISVEQAKEHAKDPAVLCCRREAGKVLEAADFEDPTLFDDYVSSGLLEIPEDTLTIEQALGATLNTTTDALNPLVPGIVDNIQGNEEASESDRDENVEEETPVVAEANNEVVNSTSSNGTFHLRIAKGEGIDLEIPLDVLKKNTANSAVDVPKAEISADVTNKDVAEDEESAEDAKVVRTLTKKYFKVDEVKFGDTTKFDGTTLYLRNPKELCKEAVDTEAIVKGMEIEIITPDDYSNYSNTIMDVQPIATKEGDSDLGVGVTKVVDGAVVVLTGTDENGVQVGEFGSSEGPLNENIMWNRPGAVDKGEIMIKIDVVIEAGTNRERKGPLGAHLAADYITQEIREALKDVDDSSAVRTEEFVQKRHPKQKRVLIVKEIMGQGAMHDNLIMPVEPVGTLGAKPNVDLGNLPVVLAPTELLDGGVHALTCIGPASKETSRHYFREPLVEEAMADEDIDLVGIALVGSPQENVQKFYVSKRLGMMVEAMNLDGAIVTTEGFGNNHIDFASHIEQIGERGVDVVGMTYAAVQGQLVVGNKYMDAMVDNNKSRQGIENEILENNTLSREDAIRALAMLETKMAGGSIKKPERQWNPNVKQNNIEIIEKETGKKIDLVENEQSLPMSKKRREIYEKDAQ